jgi:hypothetical protein
MNDRGASERNGHALALAVPFVARRDTLGAASTQDFANQELAHLLGAGHLNHVRVFTRDLSIDKRFEIWKIGDGMTNSIVAFGVDMSAPRLIAAPKTWTGTRAISSLRCPKP